MIITDPAQSDSLLKPESDSWEQENINQPLICDNCTSAITSKEQAISREGLHEHAFFNPAGIAFEIRCFCQAPGCLVQGEASAEFSWFANFCWQYALCANCLTHLGWFFVADTENKDYFFGLIANRIR